MADDAALIRRIRAIAERDPRPYEAPYAALIARLERAEADAGDEPETAAIATAVRAQVEAIITSPAELAFHFPRHVEAFPELPELVRALGRLDPDPAVRATLDEARREWSATQGDIEDPESLAAALLDELEHGDFAAGGFPLLGRYYRFRDGLCARLVDPAWLPVQRRIFGLLAMQREHWAKGYVGDYAYQGYARLGISGVKPTERRLAAWALDDVLVPGARVLDIGSNNGFLALEIARTVGQVEGIELNPYLVLVARAAQDWLGVANAAFTCGDYVDHPLEGGYDVILSLANHQTIDLNLAMPFGDYVARAWSLLRPGGHLLFESHNVFGPGLGGPGDDGDLDAKFDIAERFFRVVRHTMTRSFVPGGADVDKLFVVLRRRDEIDEAAERTFDLARARVRYDDDGA